MSPLTKGSVDLRRLVISVYSPKTNSTRLVPISPALEPLLAPLVTGDPADPLFASVHSNSNLATEVRRAIERAGMQPWPKTFQNLRHSCTQDLCEKLPAHAAASMMGHSVTVAAKHYLSVTDDHFRKISRPEGHDGSGATQNATLNTSVDAGTQRNPEQQVPDESELVASCASSEGWGMGGEGLEQPQDSTGQTGTSRSCNAKCNVDRVGPTTDGRESPNELKVLLDAWNNLPPELRIQFEQLIRGGMG